MFSFSLLYFLYLAGLAGTSNFQYAGEDLETKFSLLLFPLIFATSCFPMFSKKEIGNILRVFATGCIAGSLILLGRAFYRTVFFNEPGAFYYSSLSWSFHPSYYAMYLAFAMSNILFFLLIRQSVNGIAKVTGHILILLFFTLMIVLLSSKAGLIVWLFVIGFYAVILFVRYKRWLQGTIFLATALASFVLFLQLFPHAATRVSTANKDLASKAQSENPVKSTGERVVIWKAATEIIRKHFIFGVGTGDVKDALMEQYKADNLSEILKMKLNAHNQYLQTFISLGVSGFLVLIIMLIAPAVPALRRGDFVYVAFLCIIAINLVVESMFEGQAGVIFYALFNVLLYSSCQSDSFNNSFEIPVSQV